MLLVNYRRIMKLGDRLKQLRKNLGLSQTEIAVKLDTYQQRYAHWENGITNPDPEEIKKLADVFGVSSDWILSRKTSRVQEEQAEYVTTTPTDPLTTELLLIVRILNPESKKAVLQYAKEKLIVLKSRGTDKNLHDEINKLKRSPIGQEVSRKKRKEKSA